MPVNPQRWWYCDFIVCHPQSINAATKTGNILMFVVNVCHYCGLSLCLSATTFKIGGGRGAVSGGGEAGEFFNPRNLWTSALQTAPKSPYSLCFVLTLFFCYYLFKVSCTILIERVWPQKLIHFRSLAIFKSLRQIFDLFFFSSSFS